MSRPEREDRSYEVMDHLPEGRGSLRRAGESYKRCTSRRIGPPILKLSGCPKNHRRGGRLTQKSCSGVKLKPGTHCFSCNWLKARSITFTQYMNMYNKLTNLGNDRIANKMDNSIIWSMV